MAECPICFDNIKENHTTECGHHFCHKCIFEWLKKHNSCPMCRCVISIVQDNDLKNDPNIIIYAYQHNFLRIMDGMAGLSYSC